MMVRCGACRTQFDVPGEGRFACPVCGSVNMVRGRPAEGGPAGAPPPASMPPTGGPDDPTMAPPPPSTMAPAPPPPPDPPSPKIECPECGFSFIIGEAEIVVCPMCSAEVDTGRDDEVGEVDD